MKFKVGDRVRIKKDKSSSYFYCSDSRSKINCPYLKNTGATTCPMFDREIYRIVDICEETIKLDGPAIGCSANLYFFWSANSFESIEIWTKIERKKNA